MSLVNISIVGNLVKPPEQFCFKSGKVKTTLVVAVDGTNRKEEGKSDTDFYRIEAWGKLGEIAHKYLAKGNQVAATGRLVMNRWQDREGKERVTPTVEANQICLPPKSKSDEAKPSVTNPIVGELQFDRDDCAFIPSASAESDLADLSDSEWVNPAAVEAGPSKRG